ncbi:hypothetical protein [Floridanema evergladense]|uniref:Yip1 domain-containing protein n=1 Tax=Floridaenema evergladense BLCC-F167 TaxID=3153639 RepID=A0ABV4WSN7_9CYAN
MTKQPLNQRNEKLNIPIYSQIWDTLKQFPKVLAEGSPNPPKVSGPAAAALVSAGFGCFLMMVFHHFSETTKSVDEMLSQIGGWMPGSNNVDKMYGSLGSYAGKQTILLIGWLGSWLVLHLMWRKKNIKPRTMFFWMFVFFVAATVMNWHPLFPYLPIMPKN